MAESIIKVIVSDQVGSGKASTEDVSVITDKKQVINNQSASSSNNKFSKRMIGVYQVAKTVSNQVLSNVGTYTGNSHLQTQVNNMQTGFGLAVTAFINPAAALTSVAISSISTIWNETQRRKMEAINLANQRARNGYSDLNSILTSRRH